jgi:putative PIN family toxin of toxin-antitoxin system
MQRLVLDTNVWLDWLVFYDPGLAPLRAAQAAGRVQFFMDDACEAELARVLAYERRGWPLGEAEQAAALAACRSLVRAPDATLAHAPMRLPNCRDADDQKFLELALAAGAHALLTKDKALLDLEKRGLPFRILTPAQWLLQHNST